MSDYEGLNLPQLMDRLHGLVVPDPVSLIPQTVGWLVLLIWVSVVLLILFVHSFVRYQNNRYRREAIAALDDIAQSTPPEKQSAELAAILKRVAMMTYGRDQIAPLYGVEWAAFLGKTVDQDPLIEPHVLAMANAAYQPSDAEQLMRPARRWIEKHHD